MSTLTANHYIDKVNVLLPENTEAHIICTRLNPLLYPENTIGWNLTEPLHYTSPRYQRLLRKALKLEENGTHDLKILRIPIPIEMLDNWHHKQLKSLKK